MLKWVKKDVPQNPSWEEYHANADNFLCKIWYASTGTYESVVYDKSNNVRHRLNSSPGLEEAMGIMQMFLDAQQEI